ncbi:MAG: T9SS type A sorting domain-containing protein [Candidatus Symbiothrix sp.]|nr:T9SS type A sorting domain-containing protein [Candidatus Symbiothrix sp.]
MKRIFISFSLLLCAFALNAQSVVICDFDEVFPTVDVWGDLSIDATDAEAPASGQMGVLTVPAGNPSDGGLILQLDAPFDPRDYTGISFLCKGTVTKGGDLANPPFILKLEQSAYSDGSYRIQDWNTYPRYEGQGEWQVVQVTFDIIKRALQEELDKNANFPATDYDKIVLVPAPYEGMDEFTLNVDDFKLRTSWEDEPTAIALVNKEAAITISAINGIISAQTTTGAPASLKVYSVSGQEIASGIQQVQLETKGVYIVKASTGNASSVSKVIIK